MTIERLQAHWGFSRMPFGRDLAPSMLVATRSHSEAVARIGWLISEGALGIVTGEVGAGKTVAARAATTALDHRHLVIYLGNPSVGVRGYYRHIIATLGGTPPHQTSSLIAAAVDRLQSERAERGRRVVVVCDEAHLLDPRQLDELRFLTSDEMDSHSLFACLLVGQPTLRRRLKLGAYAALDQRVALRYQLVGMEPAETATYITQHLALAGRKDTLFSDDAISLIHQTSRGLPRAVNNLALQALIAAFADKKSVVDERSAAAAVTEIAAD
jgi:type II secretory pathway predicted ATPase ExeA